ncbi:MAG TPA: MBL fold metallo-hydrolase [Solirubrobacteraceae bacterium]|jgi:glyoxylase-like metal-dependent hydrolase (beta-lactamase superfamily II)|nr:MBL fold metallo-hydrolase [Solirubrobacteraceae bacterium]
MPDVRSRRELGRGERVLPGLFRLRLPLPWPGVPHCNAWAVAHGDGFVLFDTGMHEPDSISHLERALAMCNLRLEQARLVVCTHAHTDHCGQAATIVERAGCEVWMHPNHEHLNRMIADPEAVSARRLEIARQSGVPEEPLRRYAAERSTRGSGIAGPIEPDRDLVTGMGIVTDLGEWIVYETPGHAPSHVCFFQPERRLLVSGDHLLGRISLYFDYGYSPDPVGEFVNSLGVVEKLGARLCLAGHGRTFTDVHAHIQGNRALVGERLERVQQAVAAQPLTVFEIVPHVYGDSLSEQNAHWLLSKILCYLTHLHALGKVRRIPGEPERWAA